MMNEQIKVPKLYIDLLDQFYDIERKLLMIKETNSISRNIHRLKELVEILDADNGLYYDNPLGESYNEMRTDVEATVSGDSAEDLIIVEVVKPIIRYRKGSVTVIARKGIVVVKSKNAI